MGTMRLLVGVSCLLAGCGGGARALVGAKIPLAPPGVYVSDDVGAGYAAYKIAKKTGHNREMAGRKKNFAQRHPILTGMAAGMATHHVIKKSMKNKKNKRSE